ncbi:HlyU family transcriptional regulator, partial [Vibrio splendidus]
QYRVAGRIEKEFDGEIKTHRFIRSDVVSNKQDADELMLKKSQMFIDQMGDNIFS